MSAFHVRATAAVLAAVLQGGVAVGRAHAAPALPTPAQIEWQDMEVQTFVCLDPCTWQNQEYDNHSTPLDRINPERLDTDQWIRVAQSLGAGQVLLVAKHVGGFCWWQTETSTYGVKETPWRGGKGDVVADLAESCRRAGLKLGIYLSPADGAHGAEVGGRCATPRVQERYDAIYRQQLTELLSRYGTVSEVWFDGNLVVPVADILRQYAPNAMVFQGPQATIRWVGNEEGYAPYLAWNAVRGEKARAGGATGADSDPDGDVWLPIEVDTIGTVQHWWFWKDSPERRLRSLDELVEIYYASVGRGALLLLNQTPNTSGLIPEEDARQAAEFGAEVRRRFGRSLAETKGDGDVVRLDLPAPQVVDHVILMEDIAFGERVRDYVVEGLVDDEWRTLATGSAIGHKRIELLDPVRVSAVRLRCTRSTARPMIRRLAVFSTGVAPPAKLESTWPLGEAANAEVREAGGERVAQVHGAEAVSVGARKALRFRGDGYVSLGVMELGARDFTISAWICPAPERTGERIIVAKEKSGVNPHQFRFYVTADGRLGANLGDGSGAGLWPLESEPNAVASARWSRVTLVRSGPEVRLYVNGRLVGGKSTAAVLAHRNHFDMRIGARYAAGDDGPGDGFVGLIGEVRLWDRALSAEELALNAEELARTEGAVGM
jgi:alpha-L-fucosidase